MKLNKLIVLIFILLSINLVSAYSFINGKIYCYQEFANVSNSCITINNGTYSWDNPLNVDIPSALYDGDWSSYTQRTSGVANLEINMTTPLNVSNIIWRVKIGPIENNYTLPYECIKTGFTRRLMNLENGYNTTLFCYNETTAIYINKSVGFSFNYEEGTYYEFNYTTLLNDINYTKQVIEGVTEMYQLNISYDASYYTSYNISLNYNNTNYPATSIDSENNKNFIVSLTLPNVDTTINKSFYWKIILITSNGTIYSQNTSIFNQTINPLSLDNCSSYTNKLFNFSVFDEKNQTIITNPNLQFYISLYDSTKTNLISNLSFSSNSSTSICFNRNFTSTDNLILDGLIRYSADGYEPEYYNLMNIVLNDSTTLKNINLYDILTAESTQFKLTIKGTSIQPISNAIIYVNRKYVSEGVFKTVEAPMTDSKGSVIIHLVNNDMPYQIIAVKDGEIISTLDLTPICQVSPCTIEMSQLGTTGGVLNQYYDYFANNIISDINYDKTTKILTYTFIDTTATAHYFHLVVDKGMLNNTKYNVCDEYSYSMAGTLTCNLTNKEGDFIVHTYISRSPELPDKVFSFIVDSSVIEDTGIDMVFFNLCLLIIIITCAAVFTRGSPSGILMSFGFGILALKLIGIFPFSWPVVVSLDLLIVWLWRKVRQ